MRKIALSALLATVTLAFLGCGEAAPAPDADPGAGGPPLPGAPSEGPEALKAPKVKKH